jgi:hypothetical protein
MTIYTTADVARFLKVSPRQVGYLARLHGLGIKSGRDWQFTPAEVAKLKRRPTVGRPRKGAE